MSKKEIINKMIEEGKSFEEIVVESGAAQSYVKSCFTKVGKDWEDYDAEGIELKTVIIKEGIETEEVADEDIPEDAEVLEEGIEIGGKRIGGDTAFGIPAYESSMMHQMTAKGITDYADVTPEMKEVAIKAAQDATFKQASKLAETMTAIKKMHPAVNTVVDVVAPFTKTPSNIISTSYMYSPLPAIEMAYKRLKNGKFNH